MDNSKEFNLMLDKAITIEPLDFQDFDRTKNVQDQLQGMIMPTIIAKYVKWTTIDTSPDFNKYLAIMKWFDVLSQEGNIYANTIMTFSSEQLWLAFVMKEKYNKVWANNEWRNGSES